MARDRRPFDGDEPPRAVIDEALAELADALGPFVDRRMRKDSPANVREWEMAIETGVLVLPKGDEINASLDDPAFLLKTMVARRNRELFRPVLSRFDGNVWQAMTDLVEYRNKVAHHDRDVDDRMAEAALHNGEQLLRAIGDNTRADYLARLREPVEAREARRRARSRPIAEPTPCRVEDGVVCVGIHWEEPRGAVPEGWWIVATRGRSLITRDGGQSTDDVLEYLRTHRRAGTPLRVGLAFCFSAPEWYVRQNYGGDPAGLWDECDRHSLESDADIRAVVAALGEPFYAAGDEPLISDGPLAFRRTERTVFEETTAEPSSIFEVGAPGSVGVLAIKGMSLLYHLREDGFAVWPLDAADDADATCVEIFPRSLWAVLHPNEAPKSTARSRERFLERPDVAAFVKSRGNAETFIEDRRAFDAFVTAWSLSRFGGELPLRADDAVERLEGEIWLPAP